ncbi:hypothetical protein BKA61DRAFT_618205 [Leptodontidium sp. MPI-SDFR-AT-0119]|nr:hypothetical protein BKA61DRAFT_618205 [Leptodontidium sp. MPI-SDFR-AT-0119]
MALSPSSTNLRERIEATVRAFLSAYEEGGVNDDASIINRDVTTECTRHLLPASVPHAFGLSTDFFFDTKTYQETYAKDIKVLKFRNFNSANLVIDTNARRAAFTSIATVHPNGGESYLAEAAWFLYFNQDGSKIEKVVEFCDKEVLLKMANTAA